MHVHVDEAGTDDAVGYVDRLRRSGKVRERVSRGHARNAAVVNGDAGLRELLQRRVDCTAGKENHVLSQSLFLQSSYGAAGTASMYTRLTRKLPGNK